MNALFQLLGSIATGIVLWIVLFAVFFAAIMLLIMGAVKVFSRHAPQQPAATIPPVPFDYSRLPTLAALITSNDETAVADIQLLVHDSAAFAAKYADWLAELDFKPDWCDLITAYFLTGYDTPYKYGTYIDWKEEPAEIIHGLQAAATHLGYVLPFDEFEFDNGIFTDVALRALRVFLLTKGYSLVTWDTESDCYHLFIVPFEKHDELVKLGQSMGIRFLTNF